MLKNKKNKNQYGLRNIVLLSYSYDLWLLKSEIDLLKRAYFIKRTKLIYFLFYISSSTFYLDIILYYSPIITKFVKLLF